MWQLTRGERTERTEGWTIHRPEVETPTARAVLAFGLGDITMTLAFAAPTLPEAEQDAMVRWLLARLLPPRDAYISVTILDGRRPPTIDLQLGLEGLVVL